MDLQFEWDEAKATANARKHGVSFEEAITIFGDSNALTIFDTGHSVVPLLSVVGSDQELFHRKGAKTAKFSLFSLRPLRLCGEILSSARHQHLRGGLSDIRAWKIAS